MSKPKVKSKDDIIYLLTETGASFEGLRCTCPFHQDSNPSAGIFCDDKGHWRFRCFVCNLTLDYYDLIARREGLDIAETLRVEPPKERERHVYTSYEEALGSYEFCYEYFDRDGNLLATKTRRTMAETGKKTYGMVVPYYGGYIRQAPEAPWPLYNIRELAKYPEKAVVVVEGEKCADALSELGILATTSFTSSSVGQTDWSPLHGRKVVIWPDNDEPGYKYANAVEQELNPYCPAIGKVDPESLKLQVKEDSADYIERGHGSTDIKEVLNNAIKQTPAQGVSDYIEGMIDGSIRAVEWPWTLLHRFSQALLPGTVTLIVGPPSSSKSFLIMEALMSWVDQGEQVALYVLEENKQFHLLRALAQRAGMPGLTEVDWVNRNATQARQAMKEHKEYIDNIGKRLYAQPQRQTTYSEIFSWMREQFRAGCRIVVVDPITAAGREKDIWRADEEFVLASKKLADEFDGNVVFVTHPEKKDATPFLGNISGGAAWQKFVQNIFWLEKTKGPKFVELTDGSTAVRCNRLMHILKARNAKEMETGIIAYIMEGLKFYEQGEFRKFEN